MKKIFILLALPMLMAGCASSITNLTPSRIERSPNGLYHVEAAWNTREQAIVPDSIKPSVMVGFQTYDMRPELVVSNRWETFVPVPADQNILHYKFRFDFSRNIMSAPEQDSLLSQEYGLAIVDSTAAGK